MKEELKQNKFLPCILTIISIAQYALSNTENPIFIILFFFFVVIVTFGNEQKVIDCIFFLLPLENFFKADKHSISLTTLALVYLFITLVIKNKKLFKANIIFSLALLMVFTIQYLYLRDQMDFIEFRFIINLNIVVLMIFRNNTAFTNQIYKSIDYYIGGTLLLYLFTVSNFVRNYSISDLSFRRLYGLNGDDPNYIASYILVAITLILLKYVTIEKKVEYYILMCFFTIAGFSTLSRGFIVGIIPLCIYFLYQNVTIRNNYKYLIIVVIIGLLISFWKYIDTLLNSLAFRFQTDDEIDSGRLVIWKAYIEHIINNPHVLIIGHFKPEGEHHRAHNLLLGAMADEGALFALIELYFYYYINKMTKYKVRKIVMLLPLLSILIVYQFINASMINVFIFSVIMLMVCYSKLYKESEI